MNEKDTYTKFVVLLICIVLLISAFGISPLKDITTENSAPLSKDSMKEATFDDDSKTPQKRGTRASSPRTVLAEFFVSWSCSNCPIANPAINELMDVYDSSQLVMIAYHISSASDPFYLYNQADNNARKAYYSATSIPRLYVDGPPIIYKGAGADPAFTYSRYKDHIDTELTELSNMTITLEGYIDQVLLNGTINATIEVTDTLPAGTLNVRFAVVEDNQYAAGPNGEVRHRYVMRDMLEDELLPPLTVGQSYNVSRTFPIDPMLNIDSISVVVFVQNDDDQDVLQAASYDFIPQDILVVDDDESENPLGYEDDYHELLCQMEYAFDGWGLNERGSPSSLDLANYEAVIWITADTPSSTLTTIDQTAISDYLDNGRGSLFLTGENIGADIGSTTFYQDYLHSTFIIDDTGEGNISGVNDDPISDPFFGMTIPISGGSPSEISPISPATTVFLYSPSGDTGGIKAVHDPNSKVVYFAFMYFEGTDSDSNKMTLMERILNWMVNISVIPEGIPGSPTNLRVHKGGGSWGGTANDLVLNWTAPTWNYTLLKKNIVYYDTDLSDGFQYTNYMVFDPTNTGEGSEDGCVLVGFLADANNYVFRVNTTNDTTAGGQYENMIGTNVGYKHGIVLDTTIDWIWISIPYSSDYDWASDIANAIDAEFTDDSIISSLQRWNYTTQTYDERYYFFGMWIDDFDIEPGDALLVFVSATSPYTWKIVGAYDPDLQVEFIENADKTDYKMVSLPYHRTYQMLSDITAEFPDDSIIDIVGQYDFTTHRWDERYWSDIAGDWVNDFDIFPSPADAVFFNITKEVPPYYWQP